MGIVMFDPYSAYYLYEPTQPLPRRPLGPSTGCFSACSIIDLPGNRTRRIDQMHVGDAVWSWDHQRLQRVKAYVEKVICKSSLLLWRVDFDDQIEALYGTGEHLVLGIMGWKRLQNLKARDFLLYLGTDKPDLAAVNSVLSIAGTSPVYNLITTGPQNYIVNGFVANNYNHFPLVRRFMRRGARLIEKVTKNRRIPVCCPVP